MPNKHSAPNEGPRSEHVLIAKAIREPKVGPDHHKVLKRSNGI
jgi:hypothetical protein